MTRWAEIALLGSTIVACTDARVGTLHCEPGAPVDVHGTTYCLYRPGQRTPGVRCPELAAAPVEISDGSLVCAPSPMPACSLPEDVCQLLEGACCPAAADAGLDAGEPPVDDAGEMDAPPIDPVEDAATADSGPTGDDGGAADSGASDAGCEESIEITGPGSVVDTEIRAPGCGTSEDRSALSTFAVSNRDCSGTSSAGVLSLVRFDLAGVPPDWASATLRIYVAELDAPGRASVEIGASRLLRPWEPREVSWTEARAGDAWLRPGIVGGTSDVVLEPRAHITVLVASAPGWIDAGVSDLVREQLAIPTANHGFLLWQGVFGTVRHLTFASTEASDEAQRPRLIFRSPVACSP